MPRFLTESHSEGTPPPFREFQAFRRLLPFLWPRDDPALRWRLGLTVAMMALAAGLNALVPLLFARAVDLLATTPSLTAHDPPSGDLAAAPLALLAAYAAMTWLAKVLNELRWSLYGPLEQRLQRRMGLEVFRHLHSLSLRFHLARRTGQVSRVLDNGMRGIRELLFDAVFLILPLITEILFITLVLLRSFEPTFALITVATLTLYTVTLVIGSEWLRRHQRRAVAEGAEAHGKAVDSLLNYETIKYFGAEGRIADRYDRSLRSVERLTVKAMVSRSLTGILQVSILGAGLAIMILLAADRVAAGAMTLGDLVLVNTYLMQLIRPLDRVGQLYRSIKQSLVDLEQMVRLLDERPEIADAPDARPLAADPGTLRPGAIHPAALCFESVGFAYDPRRPVLDDVSFVIPPGRTLAIVGPTGAGKSTIGRLLFRFYDPGHGRIVFDGHDLRTLTQDSVRAAIAVVPQDAVLFNESIRFNIAFGRAGATPAEVEQAARLARIHDFIMTLPDGYDTMVGERGLKLSGGEKQRVAIARAVLKRPRLFLFDEATSALDTHTERDIQESLRLAARDTTTLIIAHRLSTVVHADEILVLDGGRVVERGTHDHLLARRGLYRSLWRRQQEIRDAAD